MRRRSSAVQKPNPVTSPRKRRFFPGTSLMIKDAKDGAITKCQKIACNDVTPNCFASISSRCARSNITSRWCHISIGEHCCLACFEEVSRLDGLLADEYKRWAITWKSNSNLDPTHRVFLTEEVLPYWVKCNLCEKWRSLCKETQLSSDIVNNFSCKSNLSCEIDKTCNAAEDSRAKAVKDLKWMENLSIPPLLKRSPAAKFLIAEYFLDGVGMSPSTTEADAEDIKVDPAVAEVLQPFYLPTGNGIAMCIRPDVMEYDEVLEFPEYARSSMLYLGLRNLIIALWALNPKRWLTPEYCTQHIICRGLARILCVKEMYRILSFLNRKGVVNFGILNKPPYRLLNVDLRKKRMVVIGAGPSGLAAARHLHNMGVQVTTLEARSRIGGRICDDFRLGVAVGRGAQLITGVVNNPIIVMCLQAGIGFRNMSEECPLIFQKSGHLVNTKLDKRVDFHFNALLDAVDDWRKVADNDETLEDGLSHMHRMLAQQTNVQFTKEDEQLLNFHKSNLEYSCGAPLNEVSALHWDQNEQFAQFAGPHALMSDGCSSVINHLAEGLDIITDFEVTKIDYSESVVKVFGASADRPILCHKVLVTLPLAVLQWEAVEFVPPLPDDKKKSISSLGAGVIEKVALKFHKKFWHVTNGANYFGNVPEDEGTKNEFTIFYDFSSKHQTDKEPCYVLMTYLSGNAVKLVRYKSDEEIVQMAVHTLRRLFPHEDVPEPENYFVTHWWEDRYSGMSYSFVKTGSSGSDYDVLAEDLEEKVYFAGEATNRHFPQTITGAYLSGLREASKMSK